MVHQGGFNVIRRISKKLSGSRITPSMKDFDKFIKESELIDPPLRNVSFRSNMKELPICKRLDGFLYTNELKQRFPQTLQDALSKLTSDHCPVVLETNPFKWGPAPFRFGNMWLLYPNFKERFKLWCRECQVNRWENYKFMKKLQFVESKLKEWNKASFGDLKEKKKNILTGIVSIDASEQEGNLTIKQVKLRALRKGELEELLLKEEVHWRQKSKVWWTKKGDYNSKFLQRVANDKRNRKFIKSFVFKEREILNIENIFKEIAHFFGKLY